MITPPYHWVTVARFWAPSEALFFQSVLEGNGIPAFVRNEHLGGLFAHLTLTQAEGGIELQVPSDLLEEAQQVLDGLETDATEIDEPDEESESELA